MEIKVEDIKNNQKNLLAQTQNLLEKCEAEEVKEPLYFSISQLYNDDSYKIKSILIGFFKGLKDHKV